MKMVNQARMGASLVGRVDFDEFTAPRARQRVVSQRKPGVGTEARLDAGIAPSAATAELSRRFNSTPLISALLRPYSGFGPPGHKASHKWEPQSLNARVS